MRNPKLTVYMAAPRGFCAGVDRAIKIVEMALEKWGEPVYVRHEIVHNKYVVDELKSKGAIFIKEVRDAPVDRPIIFSDRHFDNGLQIIMIGHEGHPETIGTMGQLPEGGVLLVESTKDVENLIVRDPSKLAYVTQTTLSIDDTAEVVEALKTRFPTIVGPHKEDICYATSNRQAAVKEIAPEVDALLVIGAPNSSNSQRLVEVAKKAGCENSQMVQRAAEINWNSLMNIKSVGITAGASAPEILVNEVVDALKERFEIKTHLVETATESVNFKVPRILREAL